MRRYVIIGSGAAGLAAAETIRSKDHTGELYMLTGDRYGYYSRPGLGFLITGEVPQDQLFPYEQGYFRSFKLQMVAQPATLIQPAEHTVQLHNGQRLCYDRLLLATGASASRPKVAGSDLQGVLKLDTMADATRFLDLSRRARSAVVVGGGITALELVEGLVANGVRTHYFLRGDRFWGSVLDETESRMVEQRLQADGVILHYNTNLVEILGQKGRVSAVRAESDGKLEDIACQIVAVAIGIEPRKELAEASGLRVKRGIMVDSFLRTTYPDIFAAGDVAEVFDPIKGEYTLDSLWAPAIDQGRAAGLNMAGHETRYLKQMPFNVTRLAGLVTTIIGRVGKGNLHKPASPQGDKDVTNIMRGDSETWRQEPDAIVAQTYAGDNRLRICVGPNSLAGAMIIGSQTISRPIQHLVREQVDIRPIRSLLLEPDAPLTELIMNFWQEYQRSNAAEIA